MKKQKVSSGKVAAGVLAGLAAGAAVGVLVAPHKGSKTRKKIMKKGGEIVHAMEDEVQHLKEGMQEKIENVKKDVKGIVKAKKDELTKKVASRLRSK